MEDIISTVNAEPEVNVEPQFDSEQVESTEQSEQTAEVAEQPKENKPVQSAEDNAKYAAIRREAEAKAREKARDEVIKEMYGDQGINTYAEYQAAIERQREQERLNELLEKNIPEEYAKEMLENKKFREQFEAEKRAMAEREKQQKEYAEFIEAFPDVKPDSIPTEVWDKVNQGIPLKYAYMEHEFKNVKVNTEQEVIKKMQQNIQTSPGSVKDNSADDDKPWTAEYIESMAEKNGADWVKKNYNKIEKSGYYK